MVYNTFAQAQQSLYGIEAIDYFFSTEIISALQTADDTATKCLTQLSFEQEQVLTHALMALSASLRDGHTCLPLSAIAQQHWAEAFDEQGQRSHQGFIFPEHEALTALMTLLNINADENKPVVFENECLYIRRYFQFEQALIHDIKARLTQRLPTSPETITNVIKQLFPTVKNEHEIDWQKIAVANAMNKNFTVIAGGPGTGKTYTVTKLLAALIMLNNITNDTINDERIEQQLEIALVAPTGKAAQRLSESIINAVGGFKALIDDQVLAAIPTQAKTIHRLLGVIPNSPNFRHDQNNLLSCDILLIDEVSMVDLPMMTRIFRALKKDTKIILLGDADQLPSVAVGSVLADIAPRPHSGYSSSNLKFLAQVCKVDEQQLKNTFKQTDRYSDHLSFLLTSRRFDGEGGIGKLAIEVINGQSKQSWQLLQSADENKENQLTLVDGDLHSWLSPLVKEYYQGISRCNTIDEAFTLLAKFRILCVTRQGEFGVDAINQWVKEQLAVNATQAWRQAQDNYHGMPIMISENDYRLGLFNGDIGLLWHVSSHSDNCSQMQGHLMAFFEQPKTTVDETSYKTLLPSRLPKYDSVYAMTIHKTQGSEFSHVAMVLPKQTNNVLLSRELLYTGITRAKTQLTIASNKQTWQQGVVNVVKRYSSLKIVE
jgi:exodeoxyribonuclease V alpha subunit